MRLTGRNAPYILQAVMALAVAATPTLAAPARSADEAAVQAVTERWAAHFAKGDFSAISGLYTDDAKLLPPNENAVSGRRAIRQWLETALRPALPGSLKFSGYEIYGGGDTATSVSEMEMFDGKGHVVERGKQTIVMLKQKGQWKIHRDMWSDNSKPAAPK